MSNIHCDGCRTSIKEIRHKCQQCPDFDYCSSCVLDAAQIHPDHDFVAMDHKTVLPSEVQDEWRARRNPSTKSDTAYRLSGRSTKMPVSICSSCASMAKTLLALPLALQDPQLREAMALGKFAICWEVRISALVTATQKGCAFCTLILERFFGPSNARTVWFGDAVRPWCMEPDQHDERQHLVAHAMKTIARLKTDKFEFEVSPRHTRDGSDLLDFDQLEVAFADSDLDQKTLLSVFPSRGQLYVSFHVFSASGTPSAHTIQSRPPNATPASEHGLSMVRKWLRECEENHPQCWPSSALESGGRPKHLIDVSLENDMLRLHRPGFDESSKYAALSYCWGGPQAFCLRKESYQSRLAGFALSDLPATLRDAVHVTKSMGIHYLWVDSLCIIQDDEEDKLSQLGVMSDIYRNAYLTICAAKAKNVDQGFLYDASDPDTNLRKDLIPLGCPVTSTKATSFDEAAQMPSEAFDTLWLKEEDWLPNSAGHSTSERGWCLQEKFLSSRFLQYGHWPTWRCNGATTSDGGWYYETDTFIEQPEHFLRDILKPRSELSDPTTSLHSVQKLMQTWRAIVAEFTTRELSVQTDKLPAIAGIAAEVQRRSNDQYCAGLWRNDLLFDMMWYAQTPEWLTRHETQLAPTWSWASVHSPVKYGEVTEDAVPLARIIDCQVDQKTALTPPVGHISLCGPVRSVGREDVTRLLSEQGMAPPPPKSDNVLEWYRQTLENIRFAPKQAPDRDKIREQLPDRVFAILTYSRDWFIRSEERVQGPCYSGLLLVEKDGGGYERIGCFMNGNHGWMDSHDSAWKTETIHLY